MNAIARSRRNLRRSDLKTRVSQCLCKERIQMLTSKELEFYHENGYVLVRGLFSQAEAAEYRKECHALATRLAAQGNIDATWGAARAAVAEAQDTKIMHCHNVQFFAGCFYAVACARELHGGGISGYRLSQCAAAPHQDVYKAPGKRVAIPYASGRSLLSAR